MIEINKKNIRFRKGVKLKIVYNGYCAIGIYYYNDVVTGYDVVEYLGYNNSKGYEAMYKLEIPLKSYVKYIDMYVLTILFKNVGVDLWH